jgi:hypothetical protein
MFTATVDGDDAETGFLLNTNMRCDQCLGLDEYGDYSGSVVGGPGNVDRKVWSKTTKAKDGNGVMEQRVESFSSSN